MEGLYHLDTNSQNASPFVTVNNTNESERVKKTTLQPLPHSQYTVRTQSSYFHDDESVFTAQDLDQHLVDDLASRVTMVGESLAGHIFPDTAFGFPINDQFVGNFYGSFLSPGGILDKQNIQDEKTTAVFLNRMISTIAHFLEATNQTSLKPLRYFTAIHSTKPVKGHPIQRKPDIILLRLIDGHYPRDGPFNWSDIQAFIEHTKEKKPPTRLGKTVTVKSYLTFCCQPERDYVVCLCITGEGFHIVITDHAGQVETDVIPLDRNVSFMIFFRMVMGLAFLPDTFLGIDATITRYEVGKHSNVTFAETYEPYHYATVKPSIMLFAHSPGLSADSSVISSTPVLPDSDNNFTTILIGTNVYKVVRLIFRSQTLIGRSTKAFLVELSDGRRGVLKDSWITTDRAPEADFLQGLDIPYGPELVDHCVLRNTDFIRKYPIRPSHIDECREKRRTLTYPAGVHISDFSSLWELMVALFDTVLCR